MPTIVTLDFIGAPPAQGGSQAAHVPEGPYNVIVTKSDLVKTRGEPAKDMIVVSFEVEGGEFEGSRLVDRFVIPQSEDDSKFPMQRFHALLAALKSAPGEKRVKFDIERLINKRLVVEVEDEENTRTHKPQSKIVAYFEKVEASSNGAVKKAAPKAEPVDDDDEEDVEDAKPALKVVGKATAAPVDADDDEDEEPTPVATAKRGRPAAAANAVEPDEDEIDNLFS